MGPLIIILAIGLIARVVQGQATLASVAINVFVVPISTLYVTSKGVLSKGAGVLNVRPMTFVVMMNVIFRKLTRAFVSPHFLRCFSLRTPGKRRNLCLKFDRLRSFLSSVFKFKLSNFLLDGCYPRPALFTSRRR